MREAAVAARKADEEEGFAGAGAAHTPPAGELSGSDHNEVNATTPVESSSKS